MRKGLQAVALLGLGGWMVGCAVTAQPGATDGDAARADDAVVTPDATPAGEDAAATQDAGGTPDAAVDPSTLEYILGRWRAVRYRTYTSSGQFIELSDGPTEADRTPYDIYNWINGTLVLGPDRLMINVTQQGSSRFEFVDIDRQGPYWRDQIRNATGRWLPTNGGFVFEDTAIPNGPSYPFQLDPEGMLWLEVRDPFFPSRSFSLGFVRDPNPARRMSLSWSSEAVWRSESIAPEAGLEPSLFWDAPGAGFLAQRLATGPWAGSSSVRRRPFAVSLTGAPPAMYQAVVGGIPVAVAALTFGSHGDTARVPAEEVPAYTLPWMIVWRGEGPDEALRDTPFEGTVPGYSIARVPLTRNGVPIYRTLWLAPFDNTHLIPLNLQARVEREPSSRSLEPYNLHELLP